MSKLFKALSCVVVALLALVAIAASVGTGNLWTSQRDINIQNQTNSVGLTITKGGNMTNNFIECYTGSVLSFYVNASGALSSLAAVTTNIFITDNGYASNFTVTNGVTNLALTASLPVFTDANKKLISKTIANTKLAMGIQSGSNVVANDFSVTNTFAQAYSGTPVVTVSSSTTNGLPAVVEVTTTYVILRANRTNQTFYWHAIGAP